MLSRTDLINRLKEATSSGSLLVPKHDPNSGLVFDRFRSVLTTQASASLDRLIKSEQYELHAYFSNIHNKHFYTLHPHDTGSYSTVGLGIPSGSFTPFGSFDTFLVASGSAGLHIYSENSASIGTQLGTGKIDDIGVL